MIKTIVISGLEIVIGFSGGLAVGSGFVALLTMLKVIPRLIQLTKSAHIFKSYIGCLIFGAIFGAYISFTDIVWSLPLLVLSVWGITHGIFNGLIIAALTEVLNVFPIVAKRVGTEKKIRFLIMAVVFGKVVGSLFQWLVFVK